MHKGVVSALVVVGVALAALSIGRAHAEEGLDIREEIGCLALNIYFEARSEPTDGKLAVGHVVMNRVSDPRYPGKVCDVVKQGGSKIINRCQFSWYCDGLSDHPRNLRAWRESIALARIVFWGYSEDPTGGALWYHADYVQPLWRLRLDRGPKIGRHVFYRDDRSTVALKAPAIHHGVPSSKVAFVGRPPKVMADAKAI